MDNNKREILKKVYLVYFVMVAVGLAIIGKAAYIQFVEGDKWREKAWIREIQRIQALLIYS